MNTYNKKQLITIFMEDANKARFLPKNDRLKTDVAILKMLDKVNNDFIATFEEGRGGLPNRGSLVECIVKHLINNVNNVTKSQRGVKDIKITHKICELSKLSYEIKFATTYANASILTNKRSCKYTILIGITGAYIINTNDLVLSGSNHVSTKSFANASRLDEWVVMFIT